MEYSAKQAAEKLSVDSRTLRNWARKGLVRYIKTLGGHYRFTSDHIIDIKEKMNVGNLPDIQSRDT